MLIISAKEWWKVVFLDEKKFNLDGPDGFHKYLQAKYFPEENYSTRHSGGQSIMIWAGGILTFRKILTTICQWSTKSSRLCEDDNDLSLAQEGCHLCGEE